MAEENLPVAVVANFREIVRTDGRRVIEILSPRIGWYYLAPEKPNVAGFLLPYKQMGHEVRPGEMICRIRTLTRERVSRRRWIPFYRTVAQDYVITSPVHGILYERSVEEGRITTKKMPALGRGDFQTLEDAIPVEYGEVLYTLLPIN